ncbi:MAG: hypothetical protein KKG59_02655 [Nanoarchaeota archaeon]|nr:hypothetical protein [Nanoarchaeota archaeon]
MHFDTWKKKTLDKLYKPDASRKGDVDEEIKELIDCINELDDFYTTSSCAGRIILVEEANIRHDVNWLYYSHKHAIFQDIEKSLDKNTGNLVWFRFESMILHISARNERAAGKLLTACQTAGLKRAGIISLMNRIMIEIIGNQKMSAPIMDQGKLLVGKDYLEILVGKANEMMGLNLERIDKLKKEINNFALKYEV